MAHVIDGNTTNFEVHFLHSGHPRHGFCIMSMDPVVYYEFQTPIGLLSTHTLVRANLHSKLLAGLPPALLPLFLKRAADKPVNTI